MSSFSDNARRSWQWLRESGTWLQKGETFEACAARAAMLVSLTAVAVVIVDRTGVLAWQWSMVILITITAGTYFVKRRLATPRTTAPDEVPSPPDEIVPLDDEDDIDDDDEDGINVLHCTLQKHWKFFAKRVSKYVVLTLAYVAVGVGMSVQSLTEVTSTVWVVYGSVLLLLLVLMVYVVKREHFRWKHLVIEIRGDDLIYKSPDSRIFFFPGGGPIVPILNIDTVMPHSRTILEMFIFRRVRSVTVDSPSDKDNLMHAMPDIQDAEEMVEEIRRRKAALVRLSGNSIR